MLYWIHSWKQLFISSMFWAAQSSQSSINISWQRPYHKVTFVRIEMALRGVVILQQLVFKDKSNILQIFYGHLRLCPYKNAICPLMFICNSLNTLHVCESMIITLRYTVKTLKLQACFCNFRLRRPFLRLLAVPVWDDAAVLYHNESTLIRFVCLLYKSNSAVSADQHSLTPLCLPCCDRNHRYLHIIKLASSDKCTSHNTLTVLIGVFQVEKHNNYPCWPSSFSFISSYSLSLPSWLWLYCCHSTFVSFLYQFYVSFLLPFFLWVSIQFFSRELKQKSNIHTYAHIQTHRCTACLPVDVVPP